MPVFRKEGDRAHETKGPRNVKRNMVLAAESEMQMHFQKPTSEEIGVKPCKDFLVLGYICLEFHMNWVGTVKIMSYVFQCLLIGN